MATYTEKVVFPEITRPNTNAGLLKVALIAFGITLAIMVGVLPFKKTFIRDLLVGRETIETDRVIFQGLTIFMWAMSAATVFIKKRRLKLELKALHDPLLPDDLSIGEDRSLVKAFEALTKRTDFGKSIVVTRVARALSAWINTRDFERTVQVAKEESELDMYLSDSSFRANRLYIWAMPLLGFVGTVYGVSYGIGGFAEFLRGSVTGEEIKVQVGIITDGLAVAFYTTLVGLLTAGAAAFPSLGAERREEEMLGSIDELIEEGLIARLPMVRKAEFPVEHFRAIRESVEALGVTLSGTIAGLGKAIADGFAQMPSPHVYEKVFASAIASAGGLINEKYGQFTTQYEQKVAALGDQLAGRLDRVAGALADAGQAQAAAQQAAATRFEQGAQRLQDSAERMRQDTAQAAAGLGHSLGQVTEVGGRIESLLQATRAMETALAKLGSTEEFARLLGGLREHLSSTDDAVKRLSRPRRVTFEETA